MDPTLHSQSSPSSCLAVRFRMRGCTEGKLPISNGIHFVEPRQAFAASTSIPSPGFVETPIRNKSVTEADSKNLNPTSPVAACPTGRSPPKPWPLRELTTPSSGHGGIIPRWTNCAPSSEARSYPDNDGFPLCAAYIIPADVGVQAQSSARSLPRLDAGDRTTTSMVHGGEVIPLVQQ
ncbi:uncharacterized protein EI97DRAFT_305180 [Westerdykella ornata]|uniref:Uncharacterized protein n=1 Tax=Westerdykella ornata TaxID=318751 RepID=A0A6A6JKI1_WESOR|nr:uncharacterized protein EI97DRAFT_305180 [Westerdykella ornata]KAF2276982.1 hypothetical protein EI97DRAFT_305180 [Westerdykella ornata]